ncbi:MAG: hypothetical protein IKM59_02995, partial [Oscillospiraceae bacterium]|nr:hypothetical protein [Oscillospiraceae bacterium]
MENARLERIKQKKHFATLPPSKGNSGIRLNALCRKTHNVSLGTYLTKGRIKIKHDGPAIAAMASFFALKG